MVLSNRVVQKKKKIILICCICRLKELKLKQTRQWKHLNVTDNVSGIFSVCYSRVPDLEFVMLLVMAG